MKIAFITEHFYPYTGGIAEHTFYLANELAKKHVVYVFAPSYPLSKYIPLPSPPNFEIIRIGKAAFFPANGSLVAFTYTPYAIFKLKKLLGEVRFDVVHIQGAPVPTLPFFSASFNMDSSYPYIKVVTFHAQHGKSLGYTLFKPFLLRAFSKITGGIAVSNSAKLTIENHFNIPNLTVIPNGVDTQRFTPHGQKIKQLVDGHFNVLFVGRMEPRKGLDILLHALKGLDKNIRLIAVGSGPLMKKYMSMCKKYGINAIFSGKVSPQKLAEYYRTANILIAPAIKGESFGIVLLEAMASGVPIIASRVEGYMETTQKGKYALTFKKKSAQELKKLIEYAMNNPHDLEDLSKRAFIYVNKHFSWEKIAAKTEEYYRFLIDLNRTVSKERISVSV